MIGTLRTILALMVALSHMPKIGISFNVGVVAVVFFYFLSGMLMARSYENFRKYDRYPALMFWLDRTIRIWPAFAAALFITVLVVKLYGSHIVSWPVPDITRHNIIQNLYVARLNGVIFGHIPNIVWSAWSLGSEVQFYAVTPLLLILPFPAVAAIAFASLGFQVHSYYIENLDMAGYWALRTCYGTFYLYCMGVCYARRADIRYAGLLGALVVSQLALMLVFYPFFRPFMVPSVMEISFGAMVVAPVVGFAEGFKSKLWDIWDHRIGSLSYPIFLCHLIGFYLADTFYPGGVASKHWVLFSMGSCLVMSIAMHWLIEVPAERLRYWIRGFRSTQTNAVVPVSP